MSSPYGAENRTFRIASGSIRSRSDNVAREFRQITPVDFLDQWRGEGSARAAYCNYPSEVCTAYPWPRPPSHTLPGSIVLARMASRATSMKLSAPTALLAENAPVSSRPSPPAFLSSLHHPSARVSSARP